MKLASWNVNGVRAASRSGFLKWFEAMGADVVCLQETKAHPDQLRDDDDYKGLLNLGKYSNHWASAVKAGYSGVAIYSKIEPLDVVVGLGDKKFDSEGRVLQMRFKDFILINAYFPNSQREGVRLGYKLEFCEAMLKQCQSLRKKGLGVIVCGDFNIAHTEIDLKNPKSNQKNAGFLPEERAWMTKFLGAGYVDTFRHFVKDPEHYTWWSYRPGVREKNIGWRIDYFCTNEEMRGRLKSVELQPHIRGSDHCPVILDLKK